jgi:hypothetical protein
LDRFSQMFGFDLIGFRQVGNRPRDLYNPDVDALFSPTTNIKFKKIFRSKTCY